MKINWNSKYFTIAFYALCTIVASELAILLIFNFDVVSEKLSGFAAVATPIIIGIFCAYLLNPLMMKLENGAFRKWSHSADRRLKARARVLSLIITMLIILGFLTMIIMLVIPQLVTNIIVIFNNMDGYIATIKNFLTDISEDYPMLAEFLDEPLNDFNNFIKGIWDQYSNQLLGFAQNVASGIWSVFDVLKNVFIGLTLSVYLLAKKEMFVGQTKKLIFAFFKPERAQRFLGVCRDASQKFLGSIIGKIIEAIIVGMLCFIGCVCMNIPFSPLIAVIMFIFNLIPFIGPFIGAIPCCLLLLLSETPISALWFVIFIIILQTIDGNVIAPWILGDQTGLPAVWILISIIIGGGFFGVLGMLLGVPVCAVVYMLIKEFIENRLKKRKLPMQTASYVGNVDYITPDYVCDEPETIVEEKVEVAEEKTRKKRLRDKVKELHEKVSHRNDDDDE
ncbi:MAG: AI-2E family transporter [Oscillospiraceae bacterium]